MPQTDNFIKYVPPDGFLWHSYFTKFNFGRGFAASPIPTPRRLRPLALDAARRLWHRETDTGGGSLNPISGSAPAGV